MTTNTTNVLDSVQLDSKARANINYVKARMAIEASLPTRGEKRKAKMAVIEFLNGTVVHPDVNVANSAKIVPAFVLFPDATKARF